MDGVQVGAADIGVITPYKAMAQQLHTMLGGLADCRAVKVDTVDAFQGQEKRVNIVQLDKRQIGLLRLRHMVTFQAVFHMHTELQSSICCPKKNLYLSCAWFEPPVHVAEVWLVCTDMCS